MKGKVIDCLLAITVIAATVFSCVSGVMLGLSGAMYREPATPPSCNCSGCCVDCCNHERCAACPEGKHYQGGHSRVGEVWK